MMIATYVTFSFLAYKKHKNLSKLFVRNSPDGQAYWEEDEHKDFALYLVVLKKDLKLIFFARKY